ncbi:hypothetical protein JOE11_001235 [Robbsia andropogonis]|uniref:carboxypeptidase-like regulatory domain-containing protein n=1 Tax=Robbsia andropogonis TaxID=28092 RepID=UPI003D20360B
MAEQRKMAAPAWMKGVGALAVSLAATLSVLSPVVHAQSADQGSLPAAAQQGDVTFLSGGVGKDESDAIKKASAHWPLSLTFIGGDRNFVADVAVKITDAKGGTVLETSAKGPYMLVRLRPGHYTVHATYSGKEQTRAVNVTDKGHARARFSWKHQ